MISGDTEVDRRIGVIEVSEHQALLAPVLVTGFLLTEVSKRSDRDPTKSDWGSRSMQRGGCTHVRGRVL